MPKISNQEFIDNYSPICNEKYPTTLLQNTPLHKYAFQKDEYSLLAEYIPEKRFFTIIRDCTEEENYLIVPGLLSKPNTRGYIITNHPYRNENFEYTIVKENC